jgi:uncharacterized membrane protein
METELTEQESRPEKKAAPSVWHRFLVRFRAVIIAGLVVTVPVGLTIWIFYWLFTNVDKLLQPLIIRIFGQEIVGVGFAVIVVLVFIIGVIATNVIGRRIIHWGESILGRVPFTRTIYVGIKQIAQSFAEPNKTGFMQVVLVEFPRKGMYTVGFITNEYIDKTGKKLINVFIPTAPNPIGGFVQIVDESEIIRTKLTIEEGLKLVVSAGRMSPKEVGDKMIRAKNEAEKSRNYEQ